MTSGSDPIQEEEILYRRIPFNQNFFDFDRRCCTPQAFSPHKDRDQDGLSVYRDKYKLPKDAATNSAGKHGLLATFLAKKLMDLGIDIRPAPLQDDPGHALLPGLNSNDRKNVRVIQWIENLISHATICDPHGLLEGKQ